MSRCLRHRGPDDSDVWVDHASGVAMGHRRLSIIDLSPEGRQPMTSASGRFVLTYNGEIYNYIQIRQELEKAERVRWRGHSDTEVMLQAFDRWGVRDTLVRANGMFALAVWDRSTRELTLARDRAGEKPLYYGLLPGGSFAFASELKALRAIPRFSPSINRQALSLYMSRGYVPAPYGIYEGIHKLPAAALLVISDDEVARGLLPSTRQYWSVADVAREGARTPFTGSSAEAVDALDHLLRDAVKSRMLSDVPLGAFLSGGIDSSTVVAFMQAVHPRPVRTFTIRMTKSTFDEADHAAAVAAHLGTDHTERTATAADALDVVPRLSTIYDEPFADSSQIPTALVSALARQHVTVSLSGDGGDELFGGYVRHMWAPRLWRRVRPFPRGAREVVGTLLRSISEERWDAVALRMMRLLPSRHRVQRPGEKLHKAADVIGSVDAADMYARLVRVWPHGMVLGVNGARKREPTAAIEDFVSRMMLMDFASYLPDDILVKVDRATMAFGLEGRAPLLDHRIIEFAWRLPNEMKIRDGTGKWILRQVLRRYVPDHLVDRPKMGFAIPVAEWLRGPLRDWAESLLDPARLRREGHFAVDPLVRTWHEHLSGVRDHQHRLWAVLMFQAWHDTWMSSAPHAGLASAD